jgi:putative membrane protein
VPEPEESRRLHPASLVFDAGRRFASLLVWSVAVLAFAARTEERWYLLFLLPPIVEGLIRYTSFRYAFGPGELVLREGLWTRSVRHVPYDRVQNIDTVQGPLHQWLGVVVVRLETAGGNEPEAVFRVISVAQLVELRERVFGVPREAATADEAFARAEDVEAEPFFRMGGADVVLFGLLAQRGLVFLGGALVALRELADLEALRARLGLGLERASQGARGLGFAGWSLLALGALLLLQLGSVAWAWLTLHGFRLERKGADLRTTCGLLTRQTASLPRERVQLLEIRSSVAQRLLGRVALRAVSAGGDSTSAAQLARKWLVPLCRRAEHDGILAEVQPEARLAGLVWQRVHPRAERRMFLRWLVVFALPVFALCARSWRAGLAGVLVALALAALLAHRRQRTLRWAVGPGAVFLRDGIFARRIACVRFGKIQSLALARSPLDRCARMAHLALDVAGDSGSQTRFVVPFLGLRAALTLRARLWREAAAVDFRW